MKDLKPGGAIRAAAVGATRGLAAGTGNGQALLISSAKEGRRVLCEDPRTSCEAVAFSPDGSRFACGMGQRVRVLDLGTGQERFEPGAGHPERIRGLAASGDGKRVISGSADGFVVLWDLTGGNVVWSKKDAHQGGVPSAALSRDGARALTGGDDGLVKLWDAATGELIRTFDGHAGSVRSVAFSPDGKLAASAGWGGRGTPGAVWLWDLTGAAPGREVARGSSAKQAFHAVAFAAGGAWVLSGGDDGKLVTWNAATNALVAERPHDGEVSALAASPDGKRALTATKDGIVRLWDLERLSDPRVLGGHGHAAEVQSVDFSPDGKLGLSTCDLDGTVRIWDLASGRELDRIPLGPDNPAYSAVFAREGRSVLAGTHRGFLLHFELVGR